MASKLGNAESFMLVSLDEEKAKKLAQVISNGTSTKILDHLAKQPAATETDIGKALGLPLSTVHYNVKQLVDAKLVVGDEYHYSEKGREVVHYKLANKYIIIAPAEEKESFLKKLREFIPAFVLVLGAAAILKFLGLLNGTLFAKASATGARDAAFMKVAPAAMVETASYGAADAAAESAADAVAGSVADEASVLMATAAPEGARAAPMMAEFAAENATNATNATVDASAAFLPPPPLTPGPELLPSTPWYFSNEVLGALVIGAFLALLLVALITWLRERKK